MGSSRTNFIEPVATLYAKALFEVALEQKQVENIRLELNELTALIVGNADLTQVLATNTFSPEEREKTIVAVAEKIQLSPFLTKFLKVLSAKGRILVLESIRDSFQSFVDQHNGVLRGTVTTVETLSDAEAAGLSKAFATKLGKQVVLESITDKGILGGLVVNIQGRTFDGSLKTTIRRLKDTLERQSI